MMRHSMFTFAALVFATLLPNVAFAQIPIVINNVQPVGGVYIVKSASPPELWDRIGEAIK